MKKKSLLGFDMPSLEMPSLDMPSLSEKTSSWSWEVEDHPPIRTRLYFIRKGLSGEIKIGISVNPYKRIKTLQTACVEDLHLLGHIPGTYADEAKLHRKFHENRLRGEWFEGTPDIVAFIDGVLKK